MKVDEDLILQELPNVSPRPSPKGWYMFDCVFCGKERHCGINFQPTQKYDYPSFNCFKCGESGSIFKLMNELGRMDLLGDNMRYSSGDKLENRLEAIEEDVDLDIPTISPPMGFKRVYDHPYLRARGFTDHQFRKYEVGVTRLYRKLRDYVIFLVPQGGLTRGYVARSTWHEEDVEIYNDNRGEDDPKHLKYMNSPGVDFSKILFGVDEITPSTDVVVVVEGITDKFNVERALGMDSVDSVRCCCTFGKKVSLEQKTILARTGVRYVVLMYDPDAIADSKRYAMELDSIFDVKVAFCRERDPGDMSQDEILDVISSAESPQSFNVNKVQKKDLR